MNKRERAGIRETEIETEIDRQREIVRECVLCVKESNRGRGIERERERLTKRQTN